MSPQEQLDAVFALAYEHGTRADETKLRPYSGRGMWGSADCVSFSTDYPEMVADEARTLGLTGTRFESLGLNYVVYWPAIEWSDAANTDDD